MPRVWRGWRLSTAFIERAVWVLRRPTPKAGMGIRVNICSAAVDSLELYLRPRRNHGQFRLKAVRAARTHTQLKHPTNTNESTPSGLLISSQVETACSVVIYIQNFERDTVRLDGQSKV